MSHLSFVNRVKYNGALYRLYYYLGGIFVSLLKLFLRPDNRLVVFSSFGGRKYDDSPKAIYEELIKDSRFNNTAIVWAFLRPESYVLPRGKIVRIDSLSYYISLLRARVWVTNSSMTRGLSFTGVNSFELNTWHGSAIKKIGGDIHENTKSFRLIKQMSTDNSIMLAQGPYDIDIFSRAFQRSKNSFRITGLPRNDLLVQNPSLMQSQLRNKFLIPDKKRVILYAPTFREFEKDADMNCVMAPPIDLKKWDEKLGNDFVLMFRSHYEVSRVMGIDDNDFVRDVSSYPNLNELMIVSDILVSDYSSIFFDYALLNRPMICFAYDYLRYEHERGLYFDIRRYLPNAADEDSLLDLIMSSDFATMCEQTRIFRETFVTEFGSATHKALDIIYDVLSNGS